MLAIGREIAIYACRKLNKGPTVHHIYILAVAGELEELLRIRMGSMDLKTGAFRSPVLRLV